MALYSFGSNQKGQLGVAGPRGGHVPHALAPSLVRSLRGRGIAAVAAGDEFTVAVAELGDVFVWGRNKEGQRGTGDRSLRCDEPTRVTALRHENVSHVAAGSQHLLACTRAGRVYQWGKLHRIAQQDDTKVMDNLVGMVGMKTKKEMVQESMRAYFLGPGNVPADGESLEENEHGGNMKNSMRAFTKLEGFHQPLPLLVKGLQGIVVKHVAAGYAFSIAISEDGRVYSWGFNDKGQLGLGHRCNAVDPQLVSELPHSVQSSSACTSCNASPPHMHEWMNETTIASSHECHAAATPCGVPVTAECGQQHVLVLCTDGSIFSWGLNVFGQLGHGDTRDRLLPARLASLQRYLDSDGAVVRQIACGAHHSVALSSHGQVFSWGHGEYGQHGGLEDHVDWQRGEAGEEGYYLVPRPLLGLNHKVKHISCGTLHNCAITENGECFSWGWGASGELGHDTRRFHLVPKHITLLQGEGMDASASGWKHTVVVKKGSLETFALDFESSVGDSSSADMFMRVRGSEKKIYCHRALVHSRCAGLRAHLLLHQRFCTNVEEDEDAPDHCSEASSNLESEEMLEIAISSDLACPASLLAFICYLYTDRLRIAPHLVLRLQQIAAHFGMRRLVQLCARDLAARGISQALSTSTRIYSLQEECTGQLVDESSFSTDMSNMFLEQHYSDYAVKVVHAPTGEFLGEGQFNPSHVETQYLNVHRVVLLARSPFFKTMMESGFLESSDGASSSCFVLEGVSMDAAAAFLHFLYCGSGDRVISGENVVELLGVADRFMADDLQQLCEQILEDELDVSNAWTLFEIGEHYHAPRLRRAAKELLVQSRDTLVTASLGSAFAHVREGSPGLVREVDAHATSCGLIEAGEVFGAQR